jgi:hypothetical protein
MANSDKQIKQQLFDWFETDDRPTQDQFEKFIYSMVIQHDDETWIEDDDPDYENYMGLGITTPVGRLSLSGSAVVGESWAGDRSINNPLIPEDGMLIEGGVKIGTFGDETRPDFYKVHIKSDTSSSPAITPHQRPFNVNSANHDVVVFSDTDGPETSPYTFLEEGNHGFRFYSWTDTVEQETMEITYDGRVRINVPAAPEARVDVEAGDLPSLKITTTHSDQFRFDGVGSEPHTFLDQSERGFRFYKATVDERMRIDDNGNVGINEPSPQYQLQIGGDLALNPGGNTYGIRDEGSLNLYANSSNTDGSNIEMHPYTFVGGGSTAYGQMNFNSYGPDVESGFYFMQTAVTELPEFSMIIQGNGNIGVNLGKLTAIHTRPAENTFHIKGETKDTGLRLETGGAEGHLLVSDDDGDAEWKSGSEMSKYGLMPYGAIMMWQDTSNMPDGWGLCNGKSHPKCDGTGTVVTPNLMGMFIAGFNPLDPSSANDRYGAVHNQGGEDLVQLKSNESGVAPHGHASSADGWTEHSGFHDTHQVHTGGNGNPDSGHLRRRDPMPDSTNSRSSIAVVPSPTHSHIVRATGSVDAIQPADARDLHENRPPYYVLAYIMKL